MQPLEEPALCLPPPPFHLSLLPLTPSVVFPPHRGLSKVGRFLYEIHVSVPLPDHKKPFEVRVSHFLLPAGSSSQCLMYSY